jgi:hypothetical protein
VGLGIDLGKSGQRRKHDSTSSDATLEFDRPEVGLPPSDPRRGNEAGPDGSTGLDRDARQGLQHCSQAYRGGAQGNAVADDPPELGLKAKTSKGGA